MFCLLQPDPLSDPLGISTPPPSQGSTPPVVSASDQRLSRLSVDISSPAPIGQKRRSSEDPAGLMSPSKRAAFSYR